jgi:hypothetical protein
VLSATGRLSKALMIRVLPGSDFLEGIELACKETEIRFPDELTVQEK